MRGHVHALAFEPHAFEGEADPLFVARFLAQLDLAARAHQTLPRKGVAVFAEDLADLAMSDLGV